MQPVFCLAPPSGLSSVQDKLLPAFAVAIVDFLEQCGRLPAEDSSVPKSLDNCLKEIDRLRDSNDSTIPREVQDAYQKARHFILHQFLLTCDSYPFNYNKMIEMRGRYAKLDTPHPEPMEVDVWSAYVHINAGPVLDAIHAAMNELRSILPRHVIRHDIAPEQYHISVLPIQDKPFDSDHRELTADEIQDTRLAVMDIARNSPDTIALIFKGIRFGDDGGVIAVFEDPQHEIIKLRRNLVAQTRKTTHDNVSAARPKPLVHITLMRILSPADSATLAALKQFSKRWEDLSSQNITLRVNNLSFGHESRWMRAAVDSETTAALGKPRIGIIGLGYVDLPTAVVLAEKGNTITCVDSNPVKIKDLNNKKSPLFEPGLEESLITQIDQQRLRFTTDIAQTVRDSDVLFIAVGTPPNPDGSADLTYVDAVAESIGRYLNGYKLIIIKSTVPLGTTERVRRIINRFARPGIFGDVAFSPEFLREGSAVTDARNPDRFAFGASSQRARELFINIFSGFNTPIVLTDITSAELSKYCANVFLANSISLANIFALYCDHAGANYPDIQEIMQLDGRIGKRSFLATGPGYGGACFPKDIQSLIAQLRDGGVDPRMLTTAYTLNQKRRLHVYGKIKRELGDLQNKRIAFLGLAFKSNTDDIRESQAVEIIKLLRARGADIAAYDPKAMDNARAQFPDISFGSDPYETVSGADAVVILTDWDEFKTIDLSQVKALLKTPLMIDARNLFDPEQMRSRGFTYVSLGRPTVRAGTLAQGTASRAKKAALDKAIMKYDREGNAQFFEGITAIVPIPFTHPISSLFRSIVGNRSDPRLDAPLSSAVDSINFWQASLGKKYIATVPIGSEHITIADLMHDYNWEEIYRNPLHKSAIDAHARSISPSPSQFALKQAAFEIIAEKIAPILHDFKSVKQPSFKISGIKRGRTAIKLVCEPAGQIDKVIVNSLREKISAVLGIAVEPYQAHITLGYVIQEPDADFTAYFDMLDAYVQAYKDDIAPITFPSIELVYFASLDRFTSFASFDWKHRGGSYASLGGIAQQLTRIRYQDAGQWLVDQAL
jgi:UDPglucose 6-dehydrogenase